jgi:hypothetical protein
MLTYACLPAVLPEESGYRKSTASYPLQGISRETVLSVCRTTYVTDRVHFALWVKRS